MKKQKLPPQQSALLPNHNCSQSHLCTIALSRERTIYCSNKNKLSKQVTLPTFIHVALLKASNCQNKQHIYNNNNRHNKL